MSSPTRRDLLKALGAGGAVSLTACGPSTTAREVTAVPAGWNRGEERWVATTCGECPAGCGVRARVIEGRAVGLTGNAAHPVNRGGLGPKGQCGLHVLHHPDRIKTPLRRVGPRGAGRWRETSWEEAIDAIAVQLRALRDKGRPEGLLILDGEAEGMVSQLWERFARAFGSPNHLAYRPPHEAISRLVMECMHGVPALPAVDWRGVNHVLAFGDGLFDSACVRIRDARTASPSRRSTLGRRVRLTQISTRFSRTAAKADRWIPIEPGTLGALAMGIAHVLIRDDLVDETFLREHAHGFTSWTDESGRERRGFRDLVLSGHAPEEVANQTGIAATTVEELAREFHERRPSLALATEEAAAAGNGLGTAMAIHALNALIGGLNRPGGISLPSRCPLTPWSAEWATTSASDASGSPSAGTPGGTPAGLHSEAHAVARADGAGTARAPLAHECLTGLLESLLAADPYPIEALFLYRSNPIFTRPAGRRWAEAFQRIPLVVSCSPLPDESTQHADFVLPDHTYLERWELVEPPASTFPILGLRRPVVTPLHDTLATGDLVIRLARALGHPVSSALPWADYREAQSERLAGVIESATGSIRTSNAAVFLSRLEEAGGWWNEDADAGRPERTFFTPSGKFEFFSRRIEGRLAELFPADAGLAAWLERHAMAVPAEDLPMPHWSPPVWEGDPDEYPLRLLPYRGIAHAVGGSRHLPPLREGCLAGRHAWKNRIEIHADDAERLGLEHGDLAVVESPAGRCRLHVRVHPGVRPGTAALALGQGSWPPEGSLDESSQPASTLLVDAADPLAGVSALQGTRVRISREVV